MYYHLFLDDEREPSNVKWIELPLVNWTIVRNYNDFVKTITEQGLPATVTFDHDLAEEHYQEHTVANDHKMLSHGTIRYNKFKEKTGYEAARWLAEYCVNKKLPLPNYYVHSWNNIGRENIKSILESARKVLTEAKE